MMIISIAVVVIVTILLLAAVFFEDESRRCRASPSSSGRPQGRGWIAVGDWDLDCRSVCRDGMDRARAGRGRDAAAGQRGELGVGGWRSLVISGGGRCVSRRSPVARLTTANEIHIPVGQRMVR